MTDQPSKTLTRADKIIAAHHDCTPQMEEALAMECDKLEAELAEARRSISEGTQREAELRACIEDHAAKVFRGELENHRRYAEELETVAQLVADDLGHAEWGTDEHGAQLLRVLIERHQPRLRAALAKKAGNEIRNVPGCNCHYEFRTAKCAVHEADTENAVSQMDAASDAVMAMTDEQVLAAARAEGIDVEANAARFRAVVEANSAKRWAGSGNYIADRVEAPTALTFANGRTVKIVNGALEVGWEAQQEASGPAVRDAEVDDLICALRDLAARDGIYWLNDAAELLDRAIPKTTVLSQFSAPWKSTDPTTRYPWVVRLASGQLFGPFTSNEAAVAWTDAQKIDHCDYEDVMPINGNAESQTGGPQ